MPLPQSVATQPYITLLIDHSKVHANGCVMIRQGQHFDDKLQCMYSTAHRGIAARP